MVAVITSNSILAEVRREEARRELAQVSLAGFLRYRFHAEGRQLEWNWHLDYLCELLEGVTDLEPSVRFLLISIWPGSLKSETIAQTWQSWMIGKRDDWWSSMVSASNSADLAARDSYKTLQILQSAWFPNVFPHFGRDPTNGLALPWPLTRQDNWQTPGGAFRQAVGADSNTTGRGAPRLLWDDILAAKDGMSETVRTKVCHWLGETFRSRLRDQVRGTITGIMQRLHELDPIGYLRKEMEREGATQYRFIDIPLEDKAGKPKVYSYRGFHYLRRAGEVAHPSRFTPQVIGELKASMKDNFDGQYNQTPVKLEGRMLKPHLFIRHNKPPEKIAVELALQPTIYMDLAVKEKQTEKDHPDWSVIGVMARDQLQRKWLLDLWRGQVDLSEVADALIAMHDKWKRICGFPQVKGEKGVIEHSFRAVMKNTCRLRKRAIIPLVGMSIPGDKIMRARPLEACINSNQFCVSSHCAWLSDYESEFRSFPKGANDDQVDMSALGVEDLESMSAGEALPIPETIDSTSITGEMLREIEKKKKLIKEAYKP